MTRRPLIGCATYHKTIRQKQPIEIIGLMPSYIEAVRAAGGLPVLIPLGLDQEELGAVLQRLDGILLPGGGDVAPAAYGGDEQAPTIRDVNTRRDEAEFALVRHALANEKPLLAICRGLQLLNVALGGSLWEDVAESMPGAIAHDYFGQGQRDYLAHPVIVREDSRLAAVLESNGTIAVNSLHHQGIHELAPDLLPVAWAPDGLVEAVELPDHPFALGVQWHPENLLESEPKMRLLFGGFIQAAGG
jgi:putative glutamine amidotransferase